MRRSHSVTLVPGARLGSYEVLSRLGAGGMGEVWRARDGRLGRDVALKFLPETFAHDRDRLARFRREAQVLASLSHPRIGAIHGLEELDGTPFLVLELVPGEDLAALLAKGPLPVEEALEIARQIAEGLEGAHESGIVHRDLKPANVKLTPGGSVKLLDFGLAKALAGETRGEGSTDISHSPTLTSPSTGFGVLLGTAAYMSPEQARGRAVDKRTDIWAFGVVLYEMLTGGRLFLGETVTDVLAAVLTKDADVSKLPARTPPRVRELIRRCLVRDARQRLHDAGDARLEIEEALRELSSGVSVGGPAASPPRAPAWTLAAAVVAAIAVGVLIGRGTTRPSTPAGFRGPLRAVVPLPEGVQLSGWASPVIALSNDGKTLAFVGEKPPAPRQLWVHDLTRGETRLVPASESAEGPFFSADGESVAFATSVSEIHLAEGPLLKRYSLKSGLTEPLAPLHDYFGGTWAKDGSIFLVDGEADGIQVLRPGARRIESVAGTFRTGGKEGKRRVYWPQELPDARSLLVVSHGQAAVVNLASHGIEELGIETGFARYAPSGHLLTVRIDGTLAAVPFDAKTGKPRGATSAALSGIAFSGNEAAVLALSENGTLAYATGYIRGSRHELVRAVRIGPDGTSRPLPVEPQEGFRLRLSPDGERAVVVGPHGTLWVLDLDRGTRRPVPGTMSAESVAISPNGRAIFYAGPTANNGADYQVHVVALDGGAPPRVLPSLDGKEVRPWTFTPDGKTLLASEIGDGMRILAWPTDGSAPPRALSIASATAGEPDLSPDGRLLAFSSSESGRSEVYVRELDGTATAPVSTAGGDMPRWARDGSELYFRQGGSLMAARVTRASGGGAPVIRTAETIAALPPDIDSYDATPKRREFVALQRVPGTGVVKEIHIVVGFFDELERLTTR